MNCFGAICSGCGACLSGGFHQCWPNALPPQPTSTFTLQRCPVCEGRGRVPAGFMSGVGTGTNPEVCPSCDGKRILKVGMFGTVEKI